MLNTDFWKQRNVLVTGHTGFKGSWLSLILQRAGARVTGYALAPSTAPSLFEDARVATAMTSVQGDVRDAKSLSDVMRDCRPDVVFHLAAQPIVRLSYVDPVGTFGTNIMGTVNVLEAVRMTDSVRAVVVVTTDKCYENKDWLWAYRENEPMGGRDPYSSSKACAELVTAAYRTSFFDSKVRPDRPVGVATARAGNVIGGGDWSVDRLVPDVVRSIMAEQPVALRNLGAVRPWQHVLDALAGYLMLAEQLYAAPLRFSEAWNFGPPEESNQPVATVVERLVALWGNRVPWVPDSRPRPHEDMFIKLDSSKSRSVLGWCPKLGLNDALQWVSEWYRAYAIDGAGRGRCVTDDQIARYFELDAVSATQPKGA